jgi:hypothetical protein
MDTRNWIVSWSYIDGVETCIDKWKIFEDLEEAREYYKRIVVDDEAIREEEDAPEGVDLFIATISAVVNSTDYEPPTMYQFVKAVDTFREVEE